ncbi:MAG: hypothetical protein IBX69_13150 [Anaerolineales bacterium]|nr:hypothetical protein [Anaerolineales bacterium]
MAAKTISEGRRVQGTAEVLHERAGRLVGYLVSHNEEEAQAVTFYDSSSTSGTVLHKVWIPAGEVVYIRFGMSSAREEANIERSAIPFSAGLAVDPGLCDVAVWAIGYG